MNAIILHGKVTKAAKMSLIYIEKKPVLVAVFTVADIGLPYQRSDPLFIQVNYRKEAASLIFGYLVENKEVLVHGILRQKFVRDEASGTKQIRYFILADMVELLPQFPKTEKKGASEKEDEE